MREDIRAQGRRNSCQDSPEEDSGAAQSALLNQ